MANETGNKESIFREKSLERLENPEKLNNYLKVTSPGVWLILATVIVFLAGVCIWGIFGKIDATVPAAIITEDGQSVCLVPESALSGVIETRTVEIDGERVGLNPSVLKPSVISEDTDVYTMLAGKLSVGDIVYPIALTAPLESDGIVSGVLVTESISPASLFFSM